MTQLGGTVRRGNNTSILAVGALTSVFVFLALLIGSFAKDAAMEYQALTFMALAGTFVIGMALWAGGLVDRDPFDESEYENTLVKFGVAASMFWGIAGLLVGVVIALQLTWPNLFYFPELGWTNFGRLRPLH
ncbi:MAG: cytochrome-c oxidase, cbb3-type subunit I, partial [Pseudomonadota bacterium]